MNAPQLQALDSNAKHKFVNSISDSKGEKERDCQAMIRIARKRFVNNKIKAKV